MLLTFSFSFSRPARSCRCSYFQPCLQTGIMANAQGSDQNSIAIVIFGKTGNGKSTLGNIILGRKFFAVGSGMNSTTLNTEFDNRTEEGIRLKVIDTPDFISLNGHDPSHKDLTEKVKFVKKKAKSSARYAVLLAIRCDIRYTNEEYDIYKQFKKIWGRNLRKHLIVAFTFGDKRSSNIKKDIENASDALKKVLKNAKDRFLVFSDLEDTNTKEEQVEKLRGMIRDSKGMKTLKKITTREAA